MLPDTEPSAGKMIGQLPNPRGLGSANPSPSINLNGGPLNFTQRPRAAGEALGFDAEFVEHGEVEVGRRQFAEVHLAAPTGVCIDAGGGLLFLVALAVLEVLAVLKTALATADEKQRIVARQVERA